MYETVLQIRIVGLFATAMKPFKYRLYKGLTKTAEYIFQNS